MSGGPHVIASGWSVSVVWAERGGSGGAAEERAGASAQKGALNTMFNGLGLDLERVWNPLKRILVREKHSPTCVLEMSLWQQ